MEMDGGFEAWKEHDLEVEGQTGGTKRQTTVRT
jgi:hypothetical protein